MPARQRLAFLAVAVVIAVVAVVLLTRTSESGSTLPTAAQAPKSQGGKATGTAAPAATPVPVLRGGTVTRITVAEGERVRFAVRSPKRQEVHVHGYDLMGDAAPGAPARFDFKATITGRFDVEFEAAGEQIGVLEVDPR